MANTIVDWNDPAIDWTQRDIDIAESVGVTRERVRQIRRRMFKPNSIHHRQRLTTVVVRKWLRDNAAKVATIQSSTNILAIMPTALRDCVSRDVVWRERNKIAPFDMDALVQSLIERTPGGCMIWRGRLTNGVPALSCRTADGLTYYVRRELYKKAHGEYPVYAKMTCGHPLCVAPAHIYSALCTRG